ncbi:ACP S-malonyltransferase [Streptomyces sp. ME19-01-6]|uniref:ACP S-malonyltransferase n=1 Tax=Streptomyces sp. ME19-01-6 TaxID=3028686 RepID=UPI0029A0CF45|nr:ACP S-malonyltransferase [Streptomyces sp. ME19-01-6]MDX3224999.1 ACP S-malonyltransferase [Streptomyces sp. ME19-01-6]
MTAEQIVDTEPANNRGDSLGAGHGGVQEALTRAAVAFPGQGSQAPRMGAAWRDHPAWRLVERAEEVLDRRLAPFLLSADDVPVATRDVQVSVFLTSLMAWEALRPVLGLPVVFFGHSLGQISALTAAGVLDFDDGVRLVSHRGDVTDQVCRRQAAGMIAVLGLDRDHAVWACGAAPGECWVANDNAPGQIVLAGTDAGLLRVEARARELGARKVIRLAIAGAFHTPLMLAAKDPFAAYLRTIPFVGPSRPVVSNADASAVTSGDTWSRLLAEHLINPVQWRISQLRLPDLGVRSLVEAGYGTTLTSIARRTVPELETRNADGPKAVSALADELAPGPAQPPVTALTGR